MTVVCDISNKSIVVFFDNPDGRDVALYRGELFARAAAAGLTMLQQAHDNIVALKQAPEVERLRQVIEKPYIPLEQPDKPQPMYGPYAADPHHRGKNSGRPNKGPKGSWRRAMQKL